MGFFKKIGSLLGLLRGDEPHGGGDDEEYENRRVADEYITRRSKRGFSVQVPVNVERSNLGPVIVPCNLGEGGVQGFRWYGRRLKIDEDGDVADEFLTEVSSHGPARDSVPPHSFEVVKYSTRAPVRKQAIAIDGNIHQSMEFQGRVVWV